MQELANIRSPWRRHYLLGYLYEQKRDYFKAFVHYQKSDYAKPNRDALCSKVRMLTILGMPFGAEAIMQQRNVRCGGEAFVQRLKKDEMAFWIRWKSIDPTIDEKERLHAIEKRIADMDRFVRTYPDSPFITQVLFDKIVALRDVYRMKEAIALYSELHSSGKKMPPYVTLAAADAYLYIRNPREALALYEKVLIDDPHSFEAKIGKFYALVESNQLTKAIQWIDDVDKKEPIWKGREPNYDKVETALDTARARYYADLLAQAHEKLEFLVKKAPANVDLLSELSNIYRDRGWPRKSAELVRFAKGYDPHDISLDVSQAWNDYTLWRYRDFSKAVQRLTQRSPRDLSVRYLKKIYDIYKNSFILQSRGEYGKSESPELGAHYLGVHTRLYSPPIDYNYRLFLLHDFASSRFLEGKQIWRRYGLGVEYKKDALRAETFVAKNISVNKSGAGVEISYGWSDIVTTTLGYQHYSDKTPLRALKHDTYANRIYGSIDLGFNESHSLSLSLSRMDFTDDNDRTEIDLLYYRRLYTTPTYKLNSYWSLSTSKNSKADTPYFNPARDSYIGMSLENILHTWRWYENSFTQALTLDFGYYKQKSFDTKPTHAFTYEHRWTYDDILDLTYGVQRARRIYDGKGEWDDKLFFNLTWRIR